MNKNRVFAGLMAGVMVSSAVVPGFSAEASGKKEKEEVIYINLDAAGSVKDIYAVNIFGKGSVVDYGDYSSVEMLNTTDEMNRNGEEISFTTDSDRVYYKGKMNSTEIPWKISICYMLDGREYESEDLAGKSGKLQIRFQVTENKAYKGGFFDHYALQASFTLDTEKCTGIEASGATMANAGSDKQISYTILPGKGIDASITADVTDFEMSAVSINGIPLSLDVDVDDEELMDQVTDLLDAIEQIDDGTGELKDGASDLKDGIADLKDGAFGLNSGAEDVDEGAAGLKSGAEDLNKGASDLTSGIADLVSGTSALSEGAAGLKSGTSDLGKGSKALNAGILEIQNGLNQLNGQSSSLKEGSAGVYKALQQIQSALNSVSASSEEIKQLVSASAQIQEGIDKLVNGANTLEENTGFEVYKSIMKENGLDIDELKKGNSQAIEQLSTIRNTLAEVSETFGSTIDTMEGLQGKVTPELLGQLQAAGMDTAELKLLLSQMDTLSEQKEQLGKLQNLTGELDSLILLLQGNNANISGTETYLNELKSKMQELSDGAEELQTNYKVFHGAIVQLTDILAGLLGQVSELQDAVNTLTEEYGKLHTGINDYTDGVAQIISGYTQIAEGSSDLVDGTAALAEGSETLWNGTEALKNGSEAVLDGSIGLYDGMEELLSGIVSFYDATGTLKDGTGELDEGVVDLLAGIVELYDGSGELKDGTSKLRSETDGMDQEITDKIDEMLETITGGDYEPESFVSEKNNDVKSVQFVIQTESIKIPEKETDEATEEKPKTFFEKILYLFGID